MLAIVGKTSHNEKNLEKSHKFQRFHNKPPENRLDNNIKKEKRTMINFNVKFFIAH